MLGPHELIAALRRTLPRYRFVGLLQDPDAAPAAEDDLIADLLNDGTVAVVVSPLARPARHAAAVAARLAADRLLGLGVDPAGAGALTALRL